LPENRPQAVDAEVVGAEHGRLKPAARENRQADGSTARLPSQHGRAGRRVGNRLGRLGFGHRSGKLSAWGEIRQERDRNHDPGQQDELDRHVASQGAQPQSWHEP